MCLFAGKPTPTGWAMILVGSGFTREATDAVPANKPSPWGVDQPSAGVRGGIMRREPVASNAAPKLSSALSL